MDIYIADADSSVDRPTYVSTQSGGFILGDKAEGDPAAVGAGGFSIVTDSVLDAGYNFVSLDYAFAPQVEYPVPVIQLSQAISFLKRHADEYGLDMSAVVLAGGSAGGQSVG